MTIEGLTLAEILKNPRAKLKDLENLSDAALEVLLTPVLTHTRPPKDFKPGISPKPKAPKKKSTEDEVNDILKDLGLPPV